jgi:hypothetical protein
MMTKQMMAGQNPMGLVCSVSDFVSEAAASASERLVPRPLRPVVDRTLVDLACAATGGVGEVARNLRVDVPAIDAWRSIGVPPEFRGRLTAMTVWSPLRATTVGRRLAA